MIREPTVGMRVRFISDRCRNGSFRGPYIKIGDTGTLTVVSCSGMNTVQMDKEDDWHYVYLEALTEIKENDMKEGDLVTINNGSWAVRVDELAEMDGFRRGERNDEYEIIGFVGHCGDALESRCDTPIHNIFIKNTDTGNIYLHSKEFVTLVKPKVKELTVADIEEKYGCKVKIIK
jgi:hypothetical protein